MSARIRFKTVVYIILLAVAAALLWWGLSYNAAQGRDYERLALINILQADFNDYFYRFNTYQIPACQAGDLISSCSGQDDRIFPAAELLDPKNSGQFRLTVAELATDNFKINFALEAGLSGLPAGEYFLTKAGVGR